MSKGILIFTAVVVTTGVVLVVINEIAARKAAAEIVTEVAENQLDAADRPALERLCKACYDYQIAHNGHYPPSLSADIAGSDVSSSCVYVGSDLVVPKPNEVEYDGAIVIFYKKAHRPGWIYFGTRSGIVEPTFVSNMDNDPNWQNSNDERKKLGLPPLTISPLLSNR